MVKHAALLCEPDQTAPLPAAAEVVRLVDELLSTDPAALDYLQTKIALDRIIDPSIDHGHVVTIVNELTSFVVDLSGGAGNSDEARMGAVRTVLYESGVWNNGQPFAYDHSDPSGASIANKLLSTYLETRLGNCVSMPILFLIVAQKAGLSVSLASAPLHLFVRWHSDSGRIINLETTSGGHPARDEWYRQQMPMTERAIANGIYMRSLTPAEAIAIMAATVLDHMIEQRQWDAAIAVAEAILRASPHETYAMVKQATAYAGVLHNDFGNFAALQRNQELFAKAEQLGWEPAA